MPKKGTHPVIAVEVERLMKERGLTLEALANKALVSEKNLRRNLKGQRATLITIKKIADALETTPNSIRADSPMRNLQGPLPISAIRPVSENSSEYVSISATMNLSPEDAVDPRLAKAFFSEVQKAMESYQRFKIKHNVMTNNALLNPEDAAKYFTSKLPNIKHQRLDVMGYYDGHSFLHYYVLRSSTFPLGSILSPKTSQSEGKPTVSLVQMLVVYHSKSEPPKEINDQLITWYGEIGEAHGFYRVLKGRMVSFFGEGRLQKFDVTVIRDDADITLPASRDSVIIPPGHAVTLDHKSNTFSPAYEPHGRDCPCCGGRHKQ